MNKCGLICESQSTFVHGRQILAGILIANELVDNARKLKQDLLLFKVDFEKPFVHGRLLLFKVNYQFWRLNHVSCLTAIF